MVKKPTAKAAPKPAKQTPNPSNEDTTQDDPAPVEADESSTDADVADASDATPPKKKGAKASKAAPPPPAEDEGDGGDDDDDEAKPAKGKGGKKTKETPEAAQRRREKALRAAGLSFLPASKVHRLPHWSTGNFSLDLALGGGLLKGRFHQFYGPQHGGKSFSCYNAMGTVQRTCRACMYPIFDNQCRCKRSPPQRPVVAYVQTEGDWDQSWATKCGVDVERLRIALPETGEAFFDDLLTMVANGALDFIVIDSVTNLTSSADVEKDMQDNTPAIHARMLAKGIRKLMVATVTAQGRNIKDPSYPVPTVLTTNQIRNKVGVVFGNPEMTTGGEALKYANSTETRIGKIGLKKSNSVGTIQQQSKFTVSKNKTYRTGMEGEFGIQLYPMGHMQPGMIVEDVSIIKAAISAGVVAVIPNNKISVLLHGEQVRAKDLLARLVEEPKFKYDLTREIISLFVDGRVTATDEVAAEEGA